MAVLQDEGFGVLSDIDVAAKMKEKLDKDMPRYRILGACNPSLANRAIGADADIGVAELVQKIERLGGIVLVVDPEDRDPFLGEGHQVRMLDPARGAPARPVIHQLHALGAQVGVGDWIDHGQSLEVDSQLAQLQAYFATPSAAIARRARSALSGFRPTTTTRAPSGETAISVGTTLLGAFFGRRRLTTGLSTATRGLGRLSGAVVGAVIHHQDPRHGRNSSVPRAGPSSRAIPSPCPYPFPIFSGRDSDQRQRRSSTAAGRDDQ